MTTNRHDMSDIDSWNDDDALVWHLADQLRNGRLALFLGAGLSQPFLKLTWQELVERTLSSKGDTLSGSSLEEEVSQFRYSHYSSDTNGYLDDVQKALYSKSMVSFESLRENPTLGAIGALVMASRRGSAKGVVTLNFDNLLELYLRYHGFVTRSVFEDTHWDGLADVTIYHPHGFLPYDNNEERSNDIVFDRISYGRALGQSGSKWREVIFSIMRTHTCVFIGLSGADLNLTSWLVDVQKEHPSKDLGSPYWGISFSTSPKTGTYASWKGMGIYCKQLVDYEKHLPEILFSVCQAAADLKE